MLAGVPHVPAVPPQTVVDAAPEPVALPTHGAGVQLAARVLGGVGLQVCPRLVHLATDLTRVLPDLVSMVDPHHMVPHGGLLDIFTTYVTGISNYPVVIYVVTGQQVQGGKLYVAGVTFDFFILRLLLLFLPSVFLHQVMI